MNQLSYNDRCLIQNALCRQQQGTASSNELLGAILSTLEVMSGATPTGGSIQTFTEDVDFSGGPYVLTPNTYNSVTVIVLAGTVFIDANTTPLPKGSYTYSGESLDTIQNLTITEDTTATVVLLLQKRT